MKSLHTSVNYLNSFYSWNSPSLSSGEYPCHLSEAPPFLTPYFPSPVSPACAGILTMGAQVGHINQPDQHFMSNDWVISETVFDWKCIANIKKKKEKRNCLHTIFQTKKHNLALGVISKQRFTCVRSNSSCSWSIFSLSDDCRLK